MADRAPPIIRVRLVGQFDVLHDGSLVPTPRNTDRLVALLVLRGVTLTRRRATEMLWPDDPPARAASHLRTLLHRLRRRVPGLVVDEAHHLDVGPGIAVDHVDLSAWSERLLTGQWTSGDLERRAPPRGFELAAQLHDDWALIERERFRQRCMNALERQVEVLLEQDRYIEAVDVGLAGVRLAPYRESIHEAVITSHLATGNRLEARRHFDLYVRLLDRGVGLPPSSRLAALVR